MPTYNRTSRSSISGFNEELEIAEGEINNRLDRTGTTGNQMEVDLDMNSNDILNASTVYTQNLAIDGALVSTSEPVAAVQTVTTETATATAGQTLFNLSNEYVAGANTLTVFVNGVKMRLNADYTETSSSSVTFTSGLSLNDIVEFYIGRYVTDATLYDSDAVTYDPPFTGSAATTVETKLSETVSVKDFGAVGDGVTDDTSAIQAAIASGEPIIIPKGTYKVSMPTSVDAGNDMVLQLSSSSSKVLVGEGYDSVIQLDLANSFDGSFDVVGLDLRDATGGVFTVGNFRVDGDSSNKKASQNNTLFRFQTGTSVTATYYEVNVLPIWGDNSTGGGCYMGCDRVSFDTMIFDNIGEHGAAIRNTSGDGRRIFVDGKSVIASNCSGLVFDYSGGSQVNQGPATSNIGSIIGKDSTFGVKIAGMHSGKLGVCDLRNINLVTMNSSAAFYTNSEFEDFTIDLLHVEDSYNGSLQHAEIGELIVNRLYGRNNNQAANNNGEVVQGGTGSSLTINDYDCIGHASSTYSVRILEGRYTYLSISRAESFDTSLNYAGLSIETNGVAYVENSTLNHSPDSGIWLARLDTNSTGKIFVNGLNTVGGAGHGPRAQGSGDVFVDNADVTGFTGNNMGDTDYALKIGSNVKGFSLNSNTTDLESLSARVNTDDKYEGKKWFNSTTNKPVYAAGSAASDVWVDATGATAHTPV